MRHMFNQGGIIRKEHGPVAVYPDLADIGRILRNASERLADFKIVMQGMLVYVKRVLGAYCEFRDFVTEDPWYGIKGPTTVLNYAYKQENMPLFNLLQENSRFGFWGKPPSYEEVSQQSLGKTFFNFDDPAFGEGISRFLSEQFPHRSKYEKE